MLKRGYKPWGFQENLATFSNMACRRWSLYQYIVSIALYYCITSLLLSSSFFYFFPSLKGFSWLHLSFDINTIYDFYIQSSRKKAILLYRT